MQIRWWDVRKRYTPKHNLKRGMSSLQMYEKVPQSEQRNNSVLWRTVRDGMAAWLLSVQEEKWVFIHNVIEIIYQCSHLLCSYSNYFSYSLAPFYYSPFPIFHYFLEFSFSSFYSSISTDFRLSIYFLRTLFLVDTLVHSLFSNPILSMLSGLSPSSLPVAVKVQHSVARSSWFSISPSLLLKRRLLFFIIIFFVIIFFWICSR